MSRTVQGDRMIIRGKSKTLEIDSLVAGDTVMMHLKGAATADMEHDLTDEILAFVSAGKNIRMDFSGLEYIAHSVQMALAELQNRYVGPAGRIMEIAGVSDGMYAVFRSTRLETQLRIRREE